LQQEEDPVQSMICVQAITDCLLLHKVQILEETDFAEAAVSELLCDLALRSQNCALKNAAIDAVCKLYFNGCFRDSKGLIVLLIVWFDIKIGSQGRFAVAQLLSAFFRNYGPCIKDALFKFEAALEGFIHL